MSILDDSLVGHCFYVTDLVEDEYVRVCKNIDNEQFSWAKKHSRERLLGCGDLISETFAQQFKARSGRNLTHNDTVVELSTVTLNERGRGNNNLVIALDGKQDGSYVLRVDGNVTQILYLQLIWGVVGENDNMIWLSFYGPTWTCSRDKNLFETFELNGVTDFQGFSWWGIEEISLECWASHKHRF